LLELLRHIDILMVNDSEARELSGDWNIYRAAQWVLSRGPTMTVIKQGEHGALLVDAESVFKVPAYPLQEVFDPTGAGDAFAGGLERSAAWCGCRRASSGRCSYSRRTASARRCWWPRVPACTIRWARTW